MSKSPFTETEMRQILERYDLCALLRSLSGPGGGEYEREIGDEYNKAIGRNSRGPATIPGFVLASAIRQYRTSPSAVTTASAPALVQTDLLDAEWIKELAAATVLEQAGMRILSGLIGDVKIPVSSSVSASWISAENGEAAQVEPTFSSKVAEPHTIAARAEISRRLNIQSKLAVNALIAEIIRDAIGRALELAAFSGTGSDGQPLGISGTTGVQTATISATPTKAEIVNLWKKILDENGFGPKMSFISSPAILATLCSTLDVRTISNGQTGADEATVAAVSSGKYLCEGGKIESYECIPSSL